MKDTGKSRLELVEEIQLLRKELIRTRAAPLQKSGTGHRVLEAAVEASLSAMALAEPTGNINYVNPAFLQMWGYDDRADVLGTSISSLVVDTSIMEKIFSTLQAGSGWVGELASVRSDGAELMVEMRASMVNDGKGNPLCMMASFLDLTERKKAEAEIRSLSEMLRHILASSPAVIYSCEPGGDYSPNYVSDNIYSMLGYTAVEFMEEPDFWVKRIHPDDRERVFSDLASLFETGRQQLAYRFMRKNGEYCWMHDDLCLISDPDGKPMEIVGYWVDVTGRIEAGKEKERLIAELQDALASIKTLKGLIPICSWCRKLKDDHGYWRKLEDYLMEQTGAELTHGMCPECYEKYTSGKMGMGSNGHRVNGDGASDEKTKKEDGAGG